MLPLGVVVDRLRSLVGPGQLGRVELTMRLEGMKDWVMPAVAVMPLEDRPDSNGQHQPQRVMRDVGVVIAVRNLADSRGAAALVELERARLLIYMQLQNWRPPPGGSPAPGGLVEYMSGRVLHLDDVIFWQDIYRLPTTILPANWPDGS